MTMCRVMIVDDEAIFRTGLAHLHNWRDEEIDIVAQAANGAEALELVEFVKPDVIITDIMMPIMDGIELVKAVRSRYPDIKLIILSSYSEFELVREVFKYGVDDYLLKPKVTAEELVTLIHNASNTGERSASNDAPLKLEPSLILSQWFEQERLSEQDREELKSQLPKPGLALLLGNITVLQGLTHASQHQLEQVVLEQCSKHLSAINHVAVFTKQIVAIVLNGDAEQIAQLQHEPSLHQFVEAVHEQYPSLTFIYGTHINGLEQLITAYNKLGQKFSKALYFNNQSFIHEDEIKLQRVEVAFDHDRFVNSIKWLTFSQASEQLFEYFKVVQEVQGLEDYELKRFTQHIIYTVMSVLEHLHLPFTENSTEKLIWFKRIDLATRLQELVDIVGQFIAMVEQQVLANQDDGQANTLRQIMDYIHEHYEQDISLAELAEQFHMNYSYLSWYFKQHTNENLTAYINKVRVEKAKELLKYTDETISHISSKIGFSEHNYFSKVFKKFVGMTPLEYRHANSGAR